MGLELANSPIGISLVLKCPGGSKDILAMCLGNSSRDNIPGLEFGV